MLGTAHDRHLDLAALVGGLPDEALAWTPCADAPALAGLVLHILDVEGHLVAIAAGEDDHWAGENGSHILDSATAEELRDAIAALSVKIRGAFASIDEATPALLMYGTDETSCGKLTAAKCRRRCRIAVRRDASRSASPADTRG